MKFTVWKQEGASTNRSKVGDYSTIDNAAKAVDDSCGNTRNHEAYAAIMERGYYNNEYGPVMYEVEEVE